MTLKRTRTLLLAAAIGAGAILVSSDAAVAGRGRSRGRTVVRSYRAGRVAGGRRVVTQPDERRRVVVTQWGRGHRRTIVPHRGRGHRRTIVTHRGRRHERRFVGRHDPRRVRRFGRSSGVYYRPRIVTPFDSHARWRYRPLRRGYFTPYRYRRSGMTFRFFFDF